METKVTLMTAEGPLQVPKHLLTQSKLIGEMLDPDCEEYPLPNIKSQILMAHIVRFWEHHEGEQMPPVPLPLKSPNMEDATSKWYQDFITGFPNEVVFELILAANYLDCKPLLDLSCAWIACQIKGKTPEEIRAHFGIVNDFTPEEEAAILEENKWCEGVN